MLRVLHLADLHLGGVLSGFSGRSAALRQARTMEVLEKTLSMAVARGADAILVAGDVFDTVTPNPDTVRRLLGLFAACGLPVVIAPGNHDPYITGGVWDSVPMPSNVYLFKSPELARFSFPSLGLDVYGYAFTGSTHAAPRWPRAADLPGGRVNLLLAHADMLSAGSATAPISGAALAASGFAFAALGHVHNPPAPRAFGDTVVAYSGFFVGRGFDECGRGHVNFVEIEEGRARVTSWEIEADRFEICRVDCTGAADGEAVRTRVSEALECAAYPEATALRVVLEGEVGTACVPDEMALSRLGRELALFEVKNQTVPLFDKEVLEREPTLRGAFYRAMKERLAAADHAERAVAAEALRMGLAALSGRELL